MRSKATVGGHPLHTILVTIPIGLFTGAVVSDVLYQVTGTIFWYDVAFWAMLGGVVSALVAAVPGMIDYFGVVQNTRAKATGMAHMLINLTVVAIYALNLVLRADYGALSGMGWALAFGMELACVALLGASGYLGGELVYRFGMGMNREAMRITMLEEDRVALERDQDDRVIR